MKLPKVKFTDVEKDSKSKQKEKTETKAKQSFYLTKFRGKWVIQVKEKTSDGKWRNVTGFNIGGLETMTEAQAKKILERKRLEYLSRDKNILTIKEAWSLFQKHLDEEHGWKRSASISQQRTNYIRHGHYKRMVKHLDLTEAEPFTDVKKHIEHYYDVLREGGLTLTTIRNYADSFRLWVTWVNRKKGLNVPIPNLLVTAREESIENKRLNVKRVNQGQGYSDDEIKAILDVSETHLRSIMVAVHTGMRVGEIHKLTWDCIRDGKIFPEIVKHGEVTRRSIRCIPIHPKLQEELDKTPIQERVGLVCSHSPTQNTFDLPRFSKIPFKIKWHMFRKTFATRCVKQGVRPEVLMQMLGHTNFQTTLRYYQLGNLPSVDDLPY